MRPYCVHGRNIPQFDGSPWQARNCGVSVARSLIHFGSRGLYLPDAGTTRARMNNLTEWTTPLDVQRAVESYDGELRRHGFRPLRYRMAGTMRGDYYLAGADRATLLRRVQRLEMVHVVVDYATVNDDFGALSGSSGFRGRHAIWIGAGTARAPGWRKRGGRIEVRYADPTWGRAGAPKRAPQWVPFWKVWKMADGAWSSRGGRGWVGGSVACAQPLPTPEPPPPPDPCDDCRTALDAALESIGVLEEQLAEAQALIEALKGKRLPRDLIDRLVALSAEIDAAYDALDSDTPLEDGVLTQEEGD